MAARHRRGRALRLRRSRSADCEFWCEVGQDAFGGWDAVDVNRIAQLRHEVDRTRCIPVWPPPRCIRRDPAPPRRVRRRTTCASTPPSPEVSGCQTHGGLEQARLAGVLPAPQPGLDLRVIHVVRDSRAVAYSWTRRVSRPDSAAASYMTTYSPARAAGHWNVQNGALQLLARTGTPDAAGALRGPGHRAGGHAEPDRGVRGPALGGPALRFLSCGRGRHVGRPARGAHGVGQPDAVPTGRVDDPAGRALADGACPACQRRTVTALTFPLLAHGYGYARWRCRRA